jgi:hypothetical protein
MTSHESASPARHILAPRATRCVVMLGLVVLAAAQTAPTVAQPPVATLAGLAGAWTSSDWGTIDLRADGTGSYSSTYGTGPGRMSLRPIGRGRFAGTWGESAQRHGTLTLELSPDGRTLTGTWTPDPSCTIGTATGGTLVWTRP